MSRFILFIHLLGAVMLPAAAADSADGTNKWLKPVREVIFISEWVAIPEDAAFVKLMKLDFGIHKISESTSENVANGVHKSKKPDPMAARNLWKMSPWADQANEMGCISYKDELVAVSNRNIYAELKSQIPVADAEVVSDRLFDSNDFTFVGAWRKARTHLGSNPKLLAALLNRLTIEQTEIVIQLLVEDADFPLDSLRNQIDALALGGRIEWNRILKVLASSYWFASKKGEMERAKELIDNFREEADGKDSHLAKALKLFGVQK